MEDNVLRINTILNEINCIINSRNRGFWNLILPNLPFIGKYLIKRRLLKRRFQDAFLLNGLVHAFKLGYVPGGVNGKPEEWQKTTLFFYFEKYHPDNAAYFKEVSSILKERMNSKANVPIKGRPEEGYQIFMSVDCIMDLEGLSPPMKHKRRRLDYGNSDKYYWINWAEEIVNHLLQTI